MPALGIITHEDGTLHAQDKWRNMREKAPKASPQKRQRRSSTGASANATL